MNGCPSPDCGFNKTYDYLYVGLGARGLTELNSKRPTRITQEGRVNLRFPQLASGETCWVYITSNSAQIVSKETWNQWLLESGCSLTPASKECPFCGKQLQPPGIEENVKEDWDRKKLDSIIKLCRKAGSLRDKIYKVEREIRELEGPLVMAISKEKENK